MLRSTGRALQVGRMELTTALASTVGLPALVDLWDPSTVSNARRML